LFQSECTLIHSSNLTAIPTPSSAKHDPNGSRLHKDAYQVQISINIVITFSRVISRNPKGFNVIFGIAYTNIYAKC
ncbi:hypothetical protein, partial [Xylella fastidiosa]|uniref:hypothetical protein n=1 Tax=Xylella fastidiosa TaxID=2371 RepID=UPI001F17D385